MKKQFLKLANFAKKHKVLTTLLLLSLLLIFWWGISATPKPLGDKMTYLGKKDYGNWLGFDSKPASTYYYGTDIDVNNLAAYFTKAKLLQQPFLENSKNTVNIQAPSSETIYIYHYPSNTQQQFKTDKRYIVEVPSFKYQAALNSL
jgi:hypothetical protein